MNGSLQLVLIYEHYFTVNKIDIKHPKTVIPTTLCTAEHNVKGKGVFVTNRHSAIENI